MSTTAPHPRARRVLSLALLACLLSLPFLPDGLLNYFRPTAHAAAAFTVNSTGDAADSNTADNVCNDGAGNCTLRAAIQQANATAGADTIGFSVTGIINLTGALPDITDGLTITGPGSAQLTVRRDTGGFYRILTINTGVVASVSGLSLMNGKTADGASGASGVAAAEGGGILNRGTLSLTGVKLEGNSTGFGGQGTSSGGHGGDGGGVFNGGTLTMTDCLVTLNSTGFGGQGTNFGGTGGDGAGVFNTGTLTVTNSVISSNQTGAAGFTNGSGGDGGKGGGIHNSGGTLTVTGTRITGNQTGGGHCSGGGAAGLGAGISILSGNVTLTNSSGAGQL